MEASVLSTVMKRPIHFLVRGDMFNPRFHWVFKWTKQIPIYRKKDVIANLRKNATTFELTYQKLANGESVLIFPEAKTILEKKMRPIQRGTAHLAFGTMPFIKDGEELMIQPVGVNFIEPRIPGTDVIVKFGEPFATRQAAREDRDAIESFTEQLSESLSPLIIQVEGELEKHYDLVASIYLRMLYENHPRRNAFDDLQKIAAVINDKAAINIVIDQTDVILDTLRKEKLENAIYFPDLIVFNKMALGMMALLKIIWLIAGGWIWRVVRNTIHKKVKTDTFQGPTTLGVFMVVMPLVTLILLIVLLIADIPPWYILNWLGIMGAGTLIRPPLDTIWKLFVLRGKTHESLRNGVLDLKEEIRSWQRTLSREHRA